MSDIKQHLPSFKSSPLQYMCMVVLDQVLDKLQAQVGTGNGKQVVDDPANYVEMTGIPPAAALNVQGIDGKFQVTITNPENILAQSPFLASLRIVNGNNPWRAKIYHQLQSATDTNFDNGSNVTDYGISRSLTLTVQDPNQTKFWRLRSSFDQRTWNDWQIYSSAQTCGPVGVWSGLLRTPALSLVNSAAMTSDGTNALTQHLTSTQIDVAGKSWNVGPQKITYQGGSTDPGVYGKFYVYAVDTTKAGGAVNYLTTQNLGDLTAQDGIIIFGTITTAGGGGGTGGGGGSCFVTGTPIEMYDGSFKDVSAIVKGDELLGTGGQKEIAQADAEPIPNVPCFQLKFDNAVLVRGVSSSEPIELESGIFRTVFELLMGTRCKTRIGIAALSEKLYIGNRLVWRLRLSHEKTYWADQLGSHNMKEAPTV